MAKVTITIDDTNPAITAAFGANALENIAAGMGYMSMVEKTEEELPAKIEVKKTDENGDSYSEFHYPEGTEMYKPNPETTGHFVGRTILKEDIAPALLRTYSKRTKAEAMQNAETQIKTANETVVDNATIIVE